MTLKKKAFENTVGKGENTEYQREIIISETFILSSAIAFNLDQSEIMLFGKGLE